MLSLGEALAEDAYPAVCPVGEDGDDDPCSGWDLDVFPEVDLRPELRLFAGAPADLAVHCRGGRVLAAHRTVLAEVGYFQAMLNGNFREHGAESLEVDEEAEVFFEVLRWVYCRDASTDKDVVLDVFRLAEFYGIDGLVDHCSRALAAVEMGGIAALEAVAAAKTAGERGEERAEEREEAAVLAQQPSRAETDAAQVAPLPGPAAAAAVAPGGVGGAFPASPAAGPVGAVAQAPASPLGGSGGGVRLPKAKDL